MKNIFSNLKIIFIAILALCFFSWLILSALLPINYVSFKSETIEKIHAYSFLFTSVGILFNMFGFKRSRKNTINHFKNFLNKEKVVKPKDVPKADCGCKNKNSE